MNILVLASEYPYIKDQNTDRTKVVGYFAREWVKQGHNVIAVVNSSTFPMLFYMIGDRIKQIISRVFNVSRTPNRLWTKRFSYEEDGVYVQNLPMLKLIPHGKFPTRVIKRQIVDIERILTERKFRPDVITGHWVNPQIFMIPTLARKYGAKSAIVFHADYSRKNCDKFGVQKYLDQIDHVGFRSKSAAEVAKEYLTFKEKPFIAASGIPVEFIEKYKVRPERNYNDELHILTAARLVGYKKIDTIIHACAKAFAKNAFHLSIVGDGPLRKKLEEQVDDLGITKHVHFAGQIPRNELQEKMRNSDIFILVSKRETFGLVYIEAMLQGCIVIASKFGGVDGIIEDGVNGFLCEEGNEEELEYILKRLEGLSKHEMIRLSVAANRRAIDYSEPKTANEYLRHILS